MLAQRRFPALLFAAALLLSAAQPQAVKSGLDPAQLARISERMKDFAGRGDIAGAVALVARHGVAAPTIAAGYRDLEGRKPMQPDTIFQIMSMTKPVTGVAVMMLLEEGKLALNDPVQKHLPEFAGLKYADGQRARPITIRDLMTHTSGMFDGAADELMEPIDNMRMTLADAMKVYAQRPLLFERNTKWSYSSPGIGVLGRIVEVASGMPYERYVASRIFEPLGMKDSFFFPPAERQARIAMVYRKRDGKLERATDHLLGGDPAAFRKDTRYPAPEWGMYSTAGDLLALYQMMLNAGTYRGKRLLSRASVELMTTNQTPHIPSGWLGGGGFGLTWEVVVGSPGTLLLHSPGTYGHGGAFGTQGWIDPKRDLIRIFLVQNSDGSAAPASAAFMAMAAAAVVD